MKKKIIVLFALVLANSLYASWPMESVNRYNVVLVHGAADRWQGLDCENGDPRANGRDYEESYNSREGIVTDASTCHPDTVQVPDADNPGAVKDSVFTRCDTAYYNPARIGGVKMSSGKIGGTAAGMMKEMVPFLNDELFDTPNAAYLQRPFVHPAGSPALNGNEIGQSNWKGTNKCSARRSLIEEAQEFKAHGQDTLKMFRESPVDQYRTIPSRNILVGHSMGGVAIREYVQGPNYKRDVDKFVTLDSPHEGTGALNALLDLDDWRHQLGDGFSSSIYAGMSAAGIALLAVGKTPSVIYPTLITMAVSFGGDALQQVAKELAWNLYFEDHGYDYRYDDGLVAYIDPEKKSSGINNLKGRAADSTFPMARLLGSENSMTFTDPNSSFREYFNLVVPEIISVPLMNAGYHFFGGDGSTTVRVVNAETGFLLGIAGITVQENGSALIPTSSGLAKNTSELESGKVDIVRKTYNAAVHAETGDQNVFSDVFSAIGLSLITTDIALSVWCSACAAAAKVAIGVTGSLYLVGGITASTYLGAQDLIESHDIPKNLDFHRSHFGEMKNYSKIQGEPQNVTPYLMEDFLYEKPFVNLGLFVSDSTLRAVDAGCYYEADDANKRQLCEIGLYGADGKVVASNGKKNYSEFRKGDLKFHSESDWSKMGVKVDRWEKVDGLHPDGSENKKGVPIRHVERYEVPAITVEDWIEKYSFVVDDLMPHRLRQIRMNFNYQEEIAWECDITEPENSDTACTVYKRSGGGSWENPIVLVDSVMQVDESGDSVKVERKTTIDKVPHPVKKNGQFDFIATDFYPNLLAIQKDNQNTVTISTVNKIGLSNTQRFYYLFKATENYLVPIWPKRDVVVNAISGFEAYASVLDYQGFDVIGMRDSLWYLDAEENKTVTQLQDMAYSRNENSGKIYGSAISKENLAEKEYHWTLKAITHNVSENKTDSSDVYDVPFRVDVTAPVFDLSVDELCVNPDSSMFVARFDWGDSSSPDIRIMRFQLEQAKENGYSVVANLPSLNHVSSKDFAIAWDKVSGKEKLTDGLYRVKATAIDYAVPNLDAYDFITDLETKIILNDDSESDWEKLNTYNFNKTEKTTEFRVDRTAPEFSFENVVGLALDSFSSEKYASFKRPSRNEGFMYV